MLFWVRILPYFPLIYFPPAVRRPPPPPPPPLPFPFPLLRVSEASPASPPAPAPLQASAERIQPGALSRRESLQQPAAAGDFKIDFPQMHFTQLQYYRTLSNIPDPSPLPPNDGLPPHQPQISAEPVYLERGLFLKRVNSQVKK